MKRTVILVVATLLTLTACGRLPNSFTEQDYDRSQSLFSTVCLDGVEYWVRSTGQEAYMATRWDPDTLQPRRCQHRPRTSITT